jgi:hypothetical protein
VPETEFGGPGFTQLPHDRLKPFQYGRQVIFMHEIERHPPIQLLCGVSQQPLEGGAFEADRPVQVQHGDDVGGMLDQLPKVRLALLQRRLGLFPLGNVQCASEHADGPAVGVTIDFAAAMDGADFAVRQDDAAVDVVRDPAL